MPDFFHNHFQIQRANTRELRDAVYALRYQVYCLENPYEDATLHRDEREMDEYDAQSVHSLVRHRDTGTVAGCVRLILPDRSDSAAPLPVEAECHQDFYGWHRAKRSGIERTRLAEVSRFAVSRQFKRRLEEAQSPSGTSPRAIYEDAGPDSELLHRSLPSITMGLIAAGIQMSVEQGVTHWYAFLEPSLLRLLSRFGIHFQQVGPPVQHHGNRRPATVRVKDVIRGVHSERPDIWAIVSDKGRFPGLEENGPWLAQDADDSRDAPCS
ncbi:PEP-CTERM/exosortase system-associated acyltransferase [Thiohalorhabdus sp.]|uniref:PEP-CTERM/exosortase system-associated acyltransferase n=1 Tax=Thiohalorhabdus sp. TaxID=3094134 RepID=UPI002FC35E2B